MEYIELTFELQNTENDENVSLEFREGWCWWML